MRSLLFIIAFAGCKKSDAPIDALDRPVGVAPGVESGVLKNGLTWYAIDARTAEPVVSLVVDAGRAHESDDQQGAAWTVALSADDAEVVVGLQSTVFTTQGALEPTLAKVADWACCLKVRDSASDLPDDLDARIGRVQRANLLRGIPGASPADLDAVDRKSAKRFQQTVYRAERMAVLVTGGGSAGHVQKLVAEAFGGLTSKNDDPLPARLDLDPDLPSRQYAVTAEDSAEVPRIQLVVRVPRAPGDNVRWFRDRLLQEVGLEVLQSRLDERARLEAAPFDGAQVSTPPLTRTMAAHTVEARGATLDSAYGALLVEVRRLAEWGVLNSEIRAAESAVVARYAERAVEPPDADGLTAYVVRLFLEGRGVPGAARESELAEIYVPSFTVAELNTWGRAFLDGPTLVHQVVTTEADAVDEKTLRDIEARVRTQTLEPPVDSGALDTLVAEAPEPGEITERDDTWSESLGVERWVLGNGAEVWVRDMDGPVAFAAQRRGGLAAVEPDSVLAARLAVAARAASGFDALEPADVARYLATRDVSVMAELADETVRLSGGSGPDEIRTALQLLHLHFASPRFTDDGVQAAVKRLDARTARRTGDAGAAFEAAWNEAVWPDDPRRAPLSSAELEALEPSGVEAVWADAFGDPATFRFVFAGDLPPDFDTQVARWLGSLPASEAGAGKSRAVSAASPGEVSVSSGLEARSRARVVFRGPLSEATAVEREHLEVLTHILDVRLRERIVEQAGGVYGVGATLRIERWPAPAYRIELGFSAHPDLLDAHLASATGLVKSLRDTPVDPVYVERALAERDSRGKAAGSTYWVESLHQTLDFDGTLDALVVDAEAADAEVVTVESLQEAANGWLADDRRTVGTLRPQAGAVTGPPPISARSGD